MDCNISNILLHKNQFTWRRGVTTMVVKRLDRAMGSSLWHSQFSNATLTTLVAPISEHTPLLLDTAPIVQCQKKFKFENKWLEEPGLNKVVYRSWQGFDDFDLL